MNFKEIRLNKGLTQAAVARHIGISRAAYTNIENGKREADYKTLKNLSELFEVSTDYLLGKIDNPTPNEFGFDDFTFALHSESRELSDDEKENLLEIARGLNLRRIEKQKEKEKEKEKEKDS